MVEKEIRTAHVPETNTRILRETTLADLGIDTSFDNLGLASDRFTLGVKKIGEDTVYVGRLEHPFAGAHFAQFLNSVSPFGGQSVDGIINDINLPILAERDYQDGKNITNSNSIFLHERHLNDPRVGPPYIRFVEDHVGTWLRALEFTDGSQVFERLQRIRFINSTEDVRKELFSEDGNLIIDLDQSRQFFIVRETLKKCQDGMYRKFCERQFLRRDDLEYIQSLLRTLTKEEQGEFAITYFMYGEKKIFVDLGTHRIRSDKSDPYDKIGKEEVQFADNGKDVMIRDKRETKVEITPTGQSSERFSWRVKEYQFSSGYIRHSLYPVIVWRKSENGKREFLTQKEAMPYIAELCLPEGEQVDTKLGEIAVAYFARDTIRNWPAKVKLAPFEGIKSRSDDLEQPMRGAQMPAWVAVKQHKGQLLKSETSVLARSE